jgi:hypothetical protein
MKRTLKAPEKFKINFGPQHLYKGHLVNIRTALLVLALEQDIQVPDKTSIVTGGVLIIIVMLMLFVNHEPSKGKCRSTVCYAAKRNASRDPLKVTAVVRTKEGHFVAICTVSKTFVVFQSFAIVDSKVTIIYSSMSLEQVLVALMTLDFWGFTEIEFLYEDAKREFVKVGTQDFLTKLIEAPIAERNLIDSAYCESCYNGYANLLISEHWITLAKYRPEV